MLKRPITFIAVDDDEAAIRQIQEMIRPFPYWKMIAWFTHPLDALKYLRKDHVDFVLLDIEMPDIDGISLMLQIPKEVRVIIYTAHNEYATDGFDKDAIDFLQKPVSIERFNQAMGKMKGALTLDLITEKKKEYRYFMLRGKVKNVRRRINLDELVYIEARDGRSYFHDIGSLDPGSEGAESPLTIRELNIQLEGTQFMQIHRSFIFNTTYFEGYAKRRVKIKGFDAHLPTGSTSNFPEFYKWMDRSNLPNSESLA